MYTPEVVDEYVAMLVTAQKYIDAIKAKKQLIKFLISEKKNDHRVRRPWLEIVILFCLADESFKAKEEVD